MWKNLPKGRYSSVKMTVTACSCDRNTKCSPRIRWVETVRKTPVIDTAKSITSGSRSAPNCWTASAPRSRPRRHIASDTPIITSTAEMSSTLNTSGASGTRQIEREDAQAEDERLVALLRGARRLEMNPPEGQRERDRGGENAAPEDEPVRRPPQRRSFLDEPLRDDVHGEECGEPGEILRHARRREEQPPAALPVETRRRFRQPHRVAVAETERGKHTGACVRDERRIEIPEPPAAEIDAGEDERGNEQAPSGGASDVSPGRSRHERSIGLERRSAVTDAAGYPRWNSTVGTLLRPGAAVRQTFDARLRPGVRALRQRLEA